MRHFGIVLFASACGFSSPLENTPTPTIDGREIDASLPLTCSNNKKDGAETDIDCGGATCMPCAVGGICATSTDCNRSVCDASVCRIAAHCRELHQEQPLLVNAYYTIDPDGASNGAAPFATFCDMTVDGGGWTLVGKADGQYTMYGVWLLADFNASALQNPGIDTGTYACVDAKHLAVNASTEIRVSNSTRTSWVKWPLPVGRTTTTWWNHAAGQVTINAEPQTAVAVTSSTGAVGACFQNIYGINPRSVHGGAYPYTAYNTMGSTLGNDLCFSIGTMAAGTAADGFTHNGNGFDAPADETTWPNPDYNVTPHVAVWLR